MCASVVSAGQAYLRWLHDGPALLTGQLWVVLLQYLLAFDRLLHV